MPNTAEYCAPTRLIPVPDWNKYHDWPPIGGLRHLIFHAKRNGFDRVLRRIGRRILIDEAAFFDWARTHGNQECATPASSRRKRAA
jgi:hypothetical protein